MELANALRAGATPNIGGPERGAILYDFLLVNGGAERVTLALAAGFPEADLCVASRNRLEISDEATGSRIIDLGANASSIPWRILKTLHAFAHRTRFLNSYDWVLYSGCYAPAAVHNHPSGRNIHYCHTIPRFAYDLRDYYLSRTPTWQRPLLKELMAYVKSSYESAIQEMDLIIANSENVRSRIHRYLKRDSIVIYPPCDTDRFRWMGQHGYYLSTARLEPFKRVDIIVEAFKRMPDQRLVVASGGSELDRLKARTSGASNILFTGWLDEGRLRRLIGEAIATIYIPKDEDFGMSPVESMAAGKPVIGVAEGGLLETIVDGETGLLLSPDATPENTIEAVHTLTPERALEMRSSCERRAQLFQRQEFLRKMRAIIYQSAINNP